MRSALTALFLAVRGAIETILFLAAVPVEIHFTSAIGTIQKPRKHAHLPIDRQPALYTFPQFLDSIKRIFIDYRLMRILKHYPVLFRKKDHRMPQIYGIRKYASDRRYRPHFGMINLFELIFPPHFMFPYYWGNRARRVKFFCYLHGAVAFHAHGVYAFYYLRRLFFDMPVYNRMADSL